MTQSNLFEKVMHNVWDNKFRDQDGSDLYNEYHDAVKVADTLGAKPVGSPAPTGDSTVWQEYLFPDGSTAQILIDSDGCGNGTKESPP